MEGATNISEEVDCSGWASSSSSPLALWWKWTVGFTVVKFLSAEDAVQMNCCYHLLFRILRFHIIGGRGNRTNALEVLVLRFSRCTMRISVHKECTQSNMEKVTNSSLWIWSVAPLFPVFDVWVWVYFSRTYNKQCLSYENATTGGGFFKQQKQETISPLWCGHVALSTQLLQQTLHFHTYLQL